MIAHGHTYVHKPELHQVLQPHLLGGLAAAGEEPGLPHAAVALL